MLATQFSPTFQNVGETHLHQKCCQHSLKTLATIVGQTERAPFGQHVGGVGDDKI